MCQPRAHLFAGSLCTGKKKKHIKGEERVNVTGEKQFGETKDLYDPKIHVGVSKFRGKKAGRWHKGHHLPSRVFLHLVPRSPCCTSGIHGDLVGVELNGDLLCDLRAEDWWLGVTSRDDPGPLKREEGGPETPLNGTLQ